jgi:hypothetical protein
MSIVKTIGCLTTVWRGYFLRVAYQWTGDYHVTFQECVAFVSLSRVPKNSKCNATEDNHLGLRFYKIYAFTVSDRCSWPVADDPRLVGREDLAASVTKDARRCEMAP